MDIPSIARPTQEEFALATRGGTQPIVVTGELESWPAWGLWDLPYFSRVFGKRKFKASVSEDGVFNADPVHGFDNVPRAYLTFAEFVELAQTEDAKKYYINQHSIYRGLNSVVQDVIPPKFTGVQKFSGVNCWIGVAGNVSPAHFDRADNILAQVVGEKVVTLFSPEDDEFLYPFPASSKVPHMSLVDIEAPDPVKFPQYCRAKPIRLNLRAGDMLYIPKGWWHHIRTTVDSISVNFW